MAKKKRYMKTRFRMATVERLEDKLPLAGDVMHNYLMPTDVNDDHYVSPLDALDVINSLSDSKRPDAGYVDVNDDGYISPTDALEVINGLQPRAARSSSADEFIPGSGEVMSRIEVEFYGDQVELEVRLVRAGANQSYDVTVGGETLGQIRTDSQGRGKLEIYYGGSGQPSVPNVLASANSSTPVAIGNAISGTLGSIGEIELGSSSSSSDGSSDDSSGSTDGGGDSSGSSSSGFSDSGSDSSSSSSSGLTDGSTDGGTDGSGSSDGNTDGMTDGISDGSSDGMTDGNTDGSSDGNTDGSSDGNTDGSSDGNSDGGSD